LGAALHLASADAGVALERGVYAGLRGPSYETPAEIRMLRDVGARAVGMSTVVEALAGHASGMRVAALSVLTNHAAGLLDQPLSHQEVLAAGAAAEGAFAALLEAAVPRFAQALA
jgi:purine-nucleoside phosphorylase